MTRSLVRSNPSELRLMNLENMLRMTDHLALTRDGIHFNTQQGRRWINDVFQTQIEEMEQELRTTDFLDRTNSTGGGGVRGNVPEPLANRLDSLVREKSGNAPPPRRQPLESRLGRPTDQSQTSSQTISRTSNPPSTPTPASTGSPSTSATPAEGIEPSSVLLWNRPDPSGWGQYKTDMSTNLNMNTLTCRVAARRMMGGIGPTVSGIYRIPGVDWLIAEQEQFSSATTLRFVDLDGLTQDNTFGPFNTRSLTDRLRRRARELTPPSHRGKFLT